MLVRADELLITQPAHAWVSGQMARAWAAPFSPFEAVCLAAEQHDAGWMEQDRAPSLNPDTGRPRHFLEMPLAAHLGVWRSASGRVVAQSRYAALLVSLHGTTLYSRRTDPPPEVQDYLEAERAVQRELASGLDADEVDANRRLVLAWDRLSLGLCLEWEQDTIADVPGFGELRLAGGNLSPWPFREPEVIFTTEARRLPGTFTSEQELSAAYAAARAEPLSLRLAAAS
jgi:hypothetical protein